MSIYLDNAATTIPCEAAANAVAHMMQSCYGNPSSLHALGIAAAKELLFARKTIAESIGAQSEELIFTSGGTEANNMALFGAVQARKRLGKKIVTTAIEHESVLQTAQALEKQGFTVVYLQPDAKGNITAQQVYDAVDSDTILVSVMYVNNEVGTILPVEALAKAVKRAKAPALVHIDCVQAYGKLPFNAKRLGADLLTISAHKVHGPKGVGALYINKNANLKAQNFARTFGGEQEQRIRPGTEATPLLAGFGEAAAALGAVKAQAQAMQALNAYAREKLTAIDGVRIHNPETASPYILNLYVPTFLRSQTIVQALSAEYGIYVSNGSACAKGKKSHVLTAMGLADELVDKSIRVSFCKHNTRADVDALAAALAQLVQTHQP